MCELAGVLAANVPQQDDLSAIRSSATRLQTAGSHFENQDKTKIKGALDRLALRNFRPILKFFSLLQVVTLIEDKRHE